MEELEFSKWFITALATSFVIPYLNHQYQHRKIQINKQIQDRELDIQELEHLRSFQSLVVDESPIKIDRIAEYYSITAPTVEIRERWLKYRAEVTRPFRSSYEERLNELEAKQKAIKVANEDSCEKNSVSDSNNSKMKESKPKKEERKSEENDLAAINEIISNTYRKQSFLGSGFGSIGDVFGFYSLKPFFEKIDALYRVSKYKKNFKPNLSIKFPLVNESLFPKHVILSLRKVHNVFRIWSGFKQDKELLETLHKECAAFATIYDIKFPNANFQIGGDLFSLPEKLSDIFTDLQEEA